MSVYAWLEDKWDRYGLMIAARAASLFSLPIEGGFWSGVMNADGCWFPSLCAYALPFTLDLIADLIVYRYGRIQQTVVKGTKKWKASRRIPWFALFNAVGSWGTSAWQLYNVMNTADNPVLFLWPCLFALIQPVMGYAVAYTQSVQDGKYDEPEPDKPTQPKPRLVQGTPDHEWWVDKIAQMNGDHEQITTADVQALILAEYTDLPSPTTLYNWAREARGNGTHERERVEEVW